MHRERVGFNPFSPQWNTQSRCTSPESRTSSSTIMIIISLIMVELLHFRFYGIKFLNEFLFTKYGNIGIPILILKNLEVKPQMNPMVLNLKISQNMFWISLYTLINNRKRSESGHVVFSFETDEKAKQLRIRASSWQGWEVHQVAAQPHAILAETLLQIATNHHQHICRRY